MVKNKKTVKKTLKTPPPRAGKIIKSDHESDHLLSVDDGSKIYVASREFDVYVKEHGDPRG